MKDQIAGNLSFVHLSLITISLRFVFGEALVHMDGIPFSSEPGHYIVCIVSCEGKGAQQRTIIVLLRRRRGRKAILSGAEAARLSRSTAGLPSAAIPSLWIRGSLRHTANASLSLAGSYRPET